MATSAVDSEETTAKEPTVTDSAFVQPIFILQSPEATHEDAVIAAARASVKAHSDFPEDPNWSPWLSNTFTKTVRRARPNKFNKLVEELGAEPVRVGTARAVAGAPRLYKDFTKTMNSAQVSGTNFPRSEGFVSLDSIVLLDFILCSNHDLGMTTGKECAQVAHAAWMAHLRGIDSWFYMSLPSEDFNTLYESGLFVVRDNGLTEFNGPTNTVVGYYV